MNCFVVLVAKSGRQIPSELIRLVTEQQPTLSFQPDATVNWSNPVGTVAVAAWCADNRAFMEGKPWSRANGGLTTVSGHVWPRGQHWQAGSEQVDQLAQLCSQLRPAALIEQLSGVYSVVSFDQTGSGYLFSDPLGLDLLYTAETADYSVFSNRAGAAAWVATKPGAQPARDALGVAWLPYATNLIGDRTGYTLVRTVPQGDYVEVTPRAGAQILTWSSTPWIGGLHSSSPDELADLVRQDIADHLHSVAALPAAHKQVALTGGRDTRLITSVIIAEGLGDKFHFTTRGQASLPDVEIACEIAERFGLDHSWGLSGPFTGISYSERVRALVHDTGGMLNIWDEAARTLAPDTVTVSGLCGEIMNTHYPHTSDVATQSELERRFHGGLRFGDIGLMQTDVQHELHKAAHASMFGDATDETSALDMIDIFFLRNRLRRWTGTEQEVNGDNRVFPLYTLAGLRAAFTIGPSQRRLEFLHRKIIEMSCPELLDWRMAGEGWATPPIKRPIRTAASDVPVEPKLVRKNRASSAPSAAPAFSGETANQHHQRRTLGQRRELLQRHLRNDPTNPVFEIIDRNRTLAALDNLEQLKLLERIRLSGAATAAIWLGHHDSGAPR